MNVLFVHNNFPAQYRYLTRALSRDPNVKMMAIGASTSRSVPGVKLKKYALGASDLAGTHPFARRFDLECQRGEQVLYALSSLVASGFTPDVILAHPGWGETLPLRIMFPKARLLVYCEFFYGVEGQDVDFDPEFPKAGLDAHIGLKLKNATTLLALNDADFGVSPTEWQRSTFPLQYQSKIATIHEGVDIDVVRPDPSAIFKLASGGELRRGDEVVTFVVRSLEPLRGYHVFMRALPRIMAERPNAQVVIVGGEGLSYGMPPPQGATWKSVFLNEVEAEIDMSRLHFVGHLPYEEYLKLLQISSAHVYLTYPFVLSWSFLEAMGAGCVVIGSDTAPVREVIEDGRNGLLVPFFDIDGLAGRVIEVLSHPSRFLEMRLHARQHVVDHFDMERLCIPSMIELMNAPASPASVKPGISAFWPGKERKADPAFAKADLPLTDNRSSRRVRVVANAKPSQGGRKAEKS
jgi:glycosyltransferase involved in cell wall biosynthesis